MTRTKKLFPVALLLLILVVAACAKAPITNRTQIILLPRSFEMELGASAYLNILETEKISRNAHYQPGREEGRAAHSRGLPHPRPEVAVHRFRQRSGKRLRASRREDRGLHRDDARRQDRGGARYRDGPTRSPHATARHGGERMTLGILLEMGSAALASAMRKKDEKTTGRVLAAYGIGSALGGRPAVFKKAGIRSRQDRPHIHGQGGLRPARGRSPSGRGWGPRDGAPRPSFSPPTQATGPG